MRVTGGILTGRTVKRPDGIIRPAMDRMRESIFAVLGDLTGKSFLDLFSGSGTIAIEAVSRGSKDVELCEKDKIKIDTILANVAMAEKESGVKIKCHFMPSEYFIKRCKRQFDIVFFDPPFAYKFHEKIVKSAAEKKIITDTGKILIHRPEEVKMPDAILDLKLCDRRIFGRSIVDFYSN